MSSYPGVRCLYALNIGAKPKPRPQKRKTKKGKPEEYPCSCCDGWQNCGCICHAEAEITGTPG